MLTTFSFRASHCLGSAAECRLLHSVSSPDSASTVATRLSAHTTTTSEAPGRNAIADGGDANAVVEASCDSVSSPTRCTSGPYATAAHCASELTASRHALEPAAASSPPIATVASTVGPDRSTTWSSRDVVATTRRDVSPTNSMACATPRCPDSPRTRSTWHRTPPREVAEMATRKSRVPAIVEYATTLPSPEMAEQIMF
mmetsp:Transcript_17878/g.46683  ORF Transcript_17878/g.46683 Transcript_17878/m.46683 type:complete len:200 (-) Transcript_17878:907-1506(-)